MNWIDLLEIDFDADNKIVHLSFRQRIDLMTSDQVDQFYGMLLGLLDRKKDRGRIYLIIDMSNLLIDPALADTYARNVKKISDQYIFPGGIARYGFKITRVTVRRGYTDHLKENPNIFQSRLEAEEYIKSLIAKTNQIASEKNSVLSERDF
jgi:hypothetical protein